MAGNIQQYVSDNIEEYVTLFLLERSIVYMRNEMIVDIVITYSCGPVLPISLHGCLIVELFMEHGIPLPTAQLFVIAICRGDPPEGSITIATSAEKLADSDFDF